MHNTQKSIVQKNSPSTKKNYNFGWISRDLAMVSKKAQYRVLKAELDELLAEESFIKKKLKNLTKRL